jgi:hypothetical protein
MGSGWFLGWYSFTIFQTYTWNIEWLLCAKEERGEGGTDVCMYLGNEKERK